MDSTALCNNILLSYRGEITSKQVDSILDSIESGTNIIPHLRNKIYIISVELLQNMYHHSDSSHSLLFMLSEENGKYEITTGNQVKKTDIPALKEKLDALNSLSPETIDEQYKKVLANGNITDKGGAGLGLIDIARRTNKPFQYDFAPVDSESSFFTLCVAVEERLNQGRSPHREGLCK